MKFAWQSAHDSVPDAHPLAAGLLDEASGIVPGRSPEHASGAREIVGYLLSRSLRNESIISRLSACLAAPEPEFGAEDEPVGPEKDAPAIAERAFRRRRTSALRPGEVSTSTRLKNSAKSRCRACPRSSRRPRRPFPECPRAVRVRRALEPRRAHEIEKRNAGVRPDLAAAEINIRADAATSS